MLVFGNPQNMCINSCVTAQAYTNLLSSFNATLYLLYILEFKHVRCSIYLTYQKKSLASA